MNISACASRVVLRTPLFLLLVVASEFALSQVVIRERVPIRPLGLQSSIASTGDPASEAYIVAPSDGTMQITGLYADQAEAMIPQSARLVTTSPLVQRSDSIWSYCSSRYYGPWHAPWGWFYNACTQAVVNGNSFSTVEGFDRTIFFPVHEGDTVRFAYWSNDWIDRCEVSSGSNPWSIHLFRSSDCYSCDSISLWINFSYADSGFAKLDVKPLRDTLVYRDSVKNSTPIAVVARSTLGREVQAPDTVKISIALSSLTPGNDHKAVLVGPLGDTALAVLNNISYRDARNGRVKVVATSRPLVSFAKFRISVSAPGQSATSGVDTVVLIRKLIYTKMLQDSSAWGDSIYDHSSDDFGTLACALCSMSMVLDAWGVAVNPLSLNRWMNENNGYTDSSGVIWDALDTYPENDKVRYDSMIGKSRKKGGQPLELPSLDGYLNDDWSVIGEVRHWVPLKSRYNTHFVVISEKDSQGKYRIVDPGSRTKSALDDYENKVYRIVLFKKAK
jgi:hypothetical protein